MQRRNMITTAIGVCVLGLAVTVGGGRADAQAPVPEAGKFVTELSQRAVANLTVPNISDTERADRFRAILEQAFDVPLIARFTLGRYWRLASDAERAEYMKLFEDYLVQNYGTRFKEYTGENLRVDQTRAGQDNEALVLSTLVRTTGGPVSVMWRLRRDGATFKIIDVVVEGVSMAITQRDDYAAVIQQAGGKVAALLNTLRDKMTVASAAPTQ